MKGSVMRDEKGGCKHRDQKRFQTTDEWKDDTGHMRRSMVKTSNQSTKHSPERVNKTIRK